MVGVHRWSTAATRPVIYATCDRPVLCPVWRRVLFKLDPSHGDGCYSYSRKLIVKQGHKDYVVPEGYGACWGGCMAKPASPGNPGRPKEKEPGACKDVCNKVLKAVTCELPCKDFDKGLCETSDFVLCKGGCLGIDECEHKCRKKIVEPCLKQLVRNGYKDCIKHVVQPYISGCEKDGKSAGSSALLRRKASPKSVRWQQRMRTLPVLGPRTWSRTRWPSRSLQPAKKFSVSR